MATSAVRNPSSPSSRRTVCRSALRNQKKKNTPSAPRAQPMFIVVRWLDFEYQSMIFAGAPLESGELPKIRMTPMTKSTTWATPPIATNNALMPRYVALLRGINIGPRNRISMAELRAALEEAGFGEVETYLQSGNVVLESRAKPESVRRQVEGVIAERFGLEIAVVLRTKAELAAVVRRNPHRRDATDPKRYQVTLDRKSVV